jgi:hypothetical protein
MQDPFRVSGDKLITKDAGISGLKERVLEGSI